MGVVGMMECGWGKGVVPSSVCASYSRLTQEGPP
jgi:hypothetical protein